MIIQEGCGVWPVSPDADYRLRSVVGFPSSCGCVGPGQPVFWISWAPFSLLRVGGGQRPFRASLFEFNNIFPCSNCTYYYWALPCPSLSFIWTPEEVALCLIASSPWAFYQKDLSWHSKKPWLKQNTKAVLTPSSTQRTHNLTAGKGKNPSPPPPPRLNA